MGRTSLNDKMVKTTKNAYKPQLIPIHYKVPAWLPDRGINASFVVKGSAIIKKSNAGYWKLDITVIVPYDDNNPIGIENSGRVSLIVDGISCQEVILRNPQGVYMRGRDVECIDAMNIRLPGTGKIELDISIQHIYVSASKRLMQNVPTKRISIFPLPSRVPQKGRSYSPWWPASFNRSI